MSQVYERMDAMQRKLWKAFFRQPSDETFQPIYDQSRALVYTLLGKEAEAQQAADRAVELGVDPASLKGAMR